MASPLYSEDLTCSICLSIFSDPVSLPCGHSFCRLCVSEALRTQRSCPQCRDFVPARDRNLKTNHTLKSLAARVQEDEERNAQRKNKEVIDMICPEHEEKLKLFCETDQQLVCVICRDGQQHDGHKFKPIKEAAISAKAKLEKAVELLIGDSNAIEHLIGQQRAEMTETENKTCQLVTQISSQFEEMHKFLRKREEKIKDTLMKKEREEYNKMTKSLNDLESVLSGRKKTASKMKSSHDITDPAGFLRAWCDGVKGEVESLMKEKPDQCRSSTDDLQVTFISLSLGPLESYLQFFVWKELLQVIRPMPEILTLKANSETLAVSQDGRSLVCCLTLSSDQTTQKHKQNSLTASSTAPSSRWAFGHGYHALSASRFLYGQHYWEIEVGEGAFWALGVKCHRDKVIEQTYRGDRGMEQATCKLVRLAKGDQHKMRDLYQWVHGFKGHVDEVAEWCDWVNKEDCIRFRNFFFRDRTRSGVVKPFKCDENIKCLVYKDQKYAMWNWGTETNITLDDKPRKIGVYLNGSSRELSFYNADNMKLIGSRNSFATEMSAFFDLGECDGLDADPMSVCWY